VCQSESANIFAKRCEISHPKLPEETAEGDVTVRGTEDVRVLRDAKCVSLPIAEQFAAVTR
jgi:hypothetical protein